MPGVLVPTAMGEETLEIDKGAAAPLVASSFFDGAITSQYGYMKMDSEMWTIAPNPSLSDYTVFRVSRTRPIWGEGTGYEYYIWTITNPSVGSIKFAFADGTYGTSIQTTSAAMGAKAFVAHGSQSQPSVITVDKYVGGYTYRVCTAYVLAQEIYSLKFQKHSLGTNCSNRTWNNGYQSNLAFGYVTTLGDSPKVAVRTEVYVDTLNVTTSLTWDWTTLNNNDLDGLAVGPSNCNGKVWNLVFRAWNQPYISTPERSYCIPSDLSNYDYIQRYPIYFYVVNSSRTHLMTNQGQLYLFVSRWFAMVADSTFVATDPRMLGD